MKVKENKEIDDLTVETGKKPKKKHKFLWIIIGVVVVFFVLSVIGSDSSDSQEDAERAKQNYTLKEMKQNSKSFSYKKVAREPKKYEGQCFKVNLYIDEVINDSVKTGSDKYYKAYVYNKKEKEEDYDQFIWLYDFQANDDNLKILKGDVIEAYTVFNGMGDSKNSVTDEVSEDVALDLHYAKLIKE